MEKSFTAAIKAAGGTIVESDPTPFPNDNFSTFLLKAPGLNPKPQVLGTMQAGGDLVNLVKQYNEYKLRDKGIGLAIGLMFLTDIHSLGPDALAGTKFTDAWYWNATTGQPRLGRQVPGQDRQAARRSRTRPTTPPRCSTWRPSSEAGTDEVRRGRQAARGPQVQRRVRQERAPSAPRTTCCSTTPTSRR